jgi:LuxR family maltose regulon positive regulatory protein
VRLSLARQRGDLPAVAEEADRLLAAAEAEAAETAQPRLGEDLRALAVISLGIAEIYTGRLEDADRHLEQGVALARRTGRPYLELTGLAHGAVVAQWRSFTLGAQRSRQAIELARRHGWAEDQALGIAYAMLGAGLVVQGWLDEAVPWFERAGQTLRTEAEPAAGMYLHYGLWALDMSRGRHADALANYQAAERLAGMLVTPRIRATWMRAHMLHTLVRLGQTERVEAALAGLGDQELASAEMRTAQASLRLAQHDPQAATGALAPVLDGSVPGVPALWMVMALLLEATARDALGDPDAAERTLDKALDVAGPDRMLFPFLVCPVPGLLQRQVRHTTAHAALIADILSLLAGTDSQGAAGSTGPAKEPRRWREPLSPAETRVLHYLPTGLSVAEIGGQLHLSTNTVRTHMRHVYDKLDVHRRHEAVERARTLGLLAPSPRGT